MSFMQDDALGCGQAEAEGGSSRDLSGSVQHSAGGRSPGSGGRRCGDGGRGAVHQRAVGGHPEVQRPAYRYKMMPRHGVAVWLSVVT